MNKVNRLAELMITGSLLLNVPGVSASTGVVKDCDWAKLPRVGDRCNIEGQPFSNRGEFPSDGINIGGLAASGTRFEIRTTKLDSKGKPVYTVLIGE